MLRITAVLLTISLMYGVHGEEPTRKLKEVWTIDKDLAAPESAYYDSESDTIYVSNIDGEGAKKDGNGYISTVSLKGEMKKAKWVSGLNAPKGIRASKGTLWVSDIDEVIGISIKDAKMTERVKIEGAKFLNDVAADRDGNVYVSDLPESKVYKISGGKYSLFAEGEELESPNGLLVDGDRLLLAGWGYAPDFSPKTPGRLLSLDLKSKKVTPITKEPTGNLDGIELDGKGGYLVTDWKAGKVLHISKNGETHLVARFESSTADHAYLPKQGLLILPHMMQNKLVAYDVRIED